MALTPNQRHLFDEYGANQRLSLHGDGLNVEYFPAAIDSETADSWFAGLLGTVKWKQDEVVVYGKRHLTPRLDCWMGESWMSYTYSNNTMSPQPWQSLPLQIKVMVEKITSDSFNSVLINYYRNGQDSNGWHADDEPELGKQPVIASLSLGAPRDFHLRHKRNKQLKHTISLEHGSLLLMRGSTQELWQHQVPKRANAQARINLTFRTMV